MKWQLQRDSQRFTYGRHGSDAARLVISVAVVIGSALLVDPDAVGSLERDVFHFVNDLPDVLFPAIWVAMQLGNLLAVPFIAGAALATRRVRMALDISVVGVAAYLGAGILKQIFERARPHQLLASVIVRGEPASGLGFVSGHAAVAAALATAAHPYLSPRGRRIVWILAFLVMASRVYVGAHLPLDVVGGAGLGLGIGALMHLVLGAPEGHPMPYPVRRIRRRSSATEEPV
ncbi:MAG: phosphatase PAP2 family protein [Actinomycetota bacterium]|nr:phosphatase PAP2 family protein [Actinomycetota bacterium]